MTYEHCREKSGASVRTPAHFLKVTRKSPVQPYRNRRGPPKVLFFFRFAEKKQNLREVAARGVCRFAASGAGIFLRILSFRPYALVYREPKALQESVFLLPSSTSFFLHLSPPLSSLSPPFLISSGAHCDECDPSSYLCIMMIKFLILVQGFASGFETDF